MLSGTFTSLITNFTFGETSEFELPFPSTVSKLISTLVLVGRILSTISSLYSSFKVNL